MIKKLITEKLNEKVNDGSLSFGYKGMVREFVLAEYQEKTDCIFCLCTYIENNQIYSKTVELTF